MRAASSLILAVAALLLGTYQTFSPTIDSGFARIQTDRGDGMLNNYILEHSWQSVSNPDYRGSLFSPPCFYPERFTIWYSEHLLGAAPVYWLLRLALPPDWAYQWWQIVLDSLNFITFALVLRWLRVDPILAILGGYLWAYGIVNIDQIKHQQMIPRFSMPLAAYYAWSFALVPATRSLNRVCAFIFLQSISCMNTGWFLVAGIGVFLLLAFLFRFSAPQELRAFARANWKRSLAILVGWTAAMVLAFVPYVIVNWMLSRSYEECITFMPTVSAWFTGAPGTRWEETIAPYRNPVFGECYLFCGFGIDIVMAAAGLYLLLARRSARSAELALAAAGLGTAAIWLLSTLLLDPDGTSLWEYIRFFPGGMAIRCVSRVYVAVYLFGFLGGIVWLNKMTASLGAGARMAILLPLAVAIVFEQTGFKPGSFEKDNFYPIAERVGQQLVGADAAYVHTEYTDGDGFKSTGVYGEVLAMWAGIDANIPVVNGYSGRWPPGDYPGGEIATEAQLRKWLKGRFHGKLAIVVPDHPEARRVIEIE